MASKKPAKKAAKKAAKKKVAKKAAKNPVAQSDSVVLEGVIELLETAEGQDSLSNKEIKEAVTKLKLVAGSGDHQERCCIERDALEIRLKKLEAFLGDTKKLGALDGAEAVRLTQQRLHMKKYLHVLNIRIANFSKKKKKKA